MRASKLLLFILFPLSLFSQGEILNDSSFVSYLKKSDPLVDKVLSDTNFRVQLKLSFLKERDSTVFIQSYGHTNEDYFYPASTVKLPIALIALEKMERLGIELDHILKIEDDVDCGNKRFVELTKRNDLTFRRIIEEMIVVSDNHFYNCLYHFIGPQEINDRLKELGFFESNIYRSFSGCDVVNHLKTNSLKVLDNDSKVVYEQGQKFMDLCDMSSCYILTENKKLGLMHEYEREILSGPYDFNYNLEIPIEELHGMMSRLIFPELFDRVKSWKLNDSSRSFLIYCLAKHPSELKNVKYRDASKYPNSWYKFSFLSDVSMDIEKSRSISKLGLSYGFTTEVAYVLNRRKQVQFQLSVSIYTNENQIVNDGDYEYEEIARPFISKITKVITSYLENQELKENSFEKEIEELVFTRK